MPDETAAPAPAAAPATASKPKGPACSHCFDTKKIDHHGIVPCPWCAGGTARKGS